MDCTQIEIQIIDENIYILFLKNPPVNAISLKLLKEIEYTINKINNDINVRSLIITSKIGHFCAGADLKERSNFSTEEAIVFLNSLNNIYNVIENMKIPIIASLSGAVLGGGAELALCCDFRIASHNIKIGFPETSLGIIPGAGGTYRLPKIIGISNAKKYIYTAKKMSSIKALEIGLIDKTVSDPLVESILLAKEIKKNAPIAISSAKQSINNSFGLSSKKGNKIETKAYLTTLSTNDRKEALKAFKEKRTPIWRNK